MLSLTQCLVVLWIKEYKIMYACVIEHPIVSCLHNFIFFNQIQLLLERFDLSTFFFTSVIEVFFFFLH